MGKRIVILGGGTGGTLAANRLHAHFGEEAEIIVVDRDDQHLYQPGLLFIPFGMEEPSQIVRSRRKQLSSGITLRLTEVDRVEVSESAVHLLDGSKLEYDVLVIATGVSLMPDETEGLTGAGWRDRTHTFYDMEGAVALREALGRFHGGRLVVNVVDMPIKCPVAPLEFSFLADWYLRRRGIRERAQITYATPLDGAFTRPTASRRLSDLLGQKQIDVVTEFNTSEVDGENGRLIGYDGREVPFDLLVSIPLHSGGEFIARSPELGDDLNFVEADIHTLQSRAAPNVFAIGDVASLPTSKAGSATHFEAATLVANVVHLLAGEDLEGSYDGHVNCFVETGFRRALLIDFNYEVEPLAGRYPDPLLGPLPLLQNSRLNHLGKLAFQPLYWHMLLPGHDIPGIPSQMSMRGRDLPSSEQGAIP